jgi:transcriptional regulator GlxA family with amidase domain
MDCLIVLGVPGMDPHAVTDALSVEARHVRPLIALARRQGARIAATCAGGYLLADSGILDGKRATISWWLKDEVARLFPRVRWEPSRLLVRQGRIYTTGAGFSGLELITTLLVDLGFPDQERRVRKLMVLPPPREFQSPYEFPMSDVVPQVEPFEGRLNEIAKKNIRYLSLTLLAQELGMSARTLTRRFHEKLDFTPGKWIQAKRLEMARLLLEDTRLKLAEVCYRVGYQDVPSFCRLFAKTTGMAPGEFRKQIRV